jgi:hypothetical protein
MDKSPVRAEADPVLIWILAYKFQSMGFRPFRAQVPFHPESKGRCPLLFPSLFQGGKNLYAHVLVYLSCIKK